MPKRKSGDLLREEVNRLREEMRLLRDQAGMGMRSGDSSEPTERVPALDRKFFRHARDLLPASRLIALDSQVS